MWIEICFIFAFWVVSVRETFPYLFSIWFGKLDQNKTNQFKQLRKSSNILLTDPQKRSSRTFPLNIDDRLHDTSSDRALDGLELFAALSHTVEAYITRMNDKNPVSPARIQKLYEGVASKMYWVIISLTVVAERLCCDRCLSVHKGAGVHPLGRHPP